MLLQICLRTSQEVLWEGEAQSARLPGSAGEFEVMAHHAPMITTLRAGVVALRTFLSPQVPAAPRVFLVQRGLAWLIRNRLVVLTG